jgi:uncharacterized protein
MRFPSVTAAYVAVLALVFAALSLQVVRLRRRNRIGFGDGEITHLRSAIRAHAHFAEYVPIIALMCAMLESSGLPAIRVHLLMGALLIARLLHPLGMYAKAGTLQFRLGRVGGMVITILVMISCALLILQRSWLRG